KWFGDDIALKSGKYTEHDPRSLRAAATGIRLLGAGNPPLHRFRVGLEFAMHGYREVEAMMDTHAQIAKSLARQLGLDEAVQAAVGGSYERWDGKGWPGELRGEQIPVAARITQLSEFVEVAHRIGGTGAAIALARKRSGTQFDPHLADVLCAKAESVFGDLDETRTWNQVIAAEPSLGVRLVGADIDAALLAIADFVDLKSPYTLGHARAVAELCAGAATQLGMPADEIATVRRAGLVHALGRLGVSNSIWDKPGPLGPGEWERIRMHPYLTERILHQSAALAPLGEIAVQHRERLDGSGYPRGLSGASISRPARILAAADAYQSMREPRPHRDALDAGAAAELLQADVRAGRLDADAVHAVLAAAGHRGARRREGAAGLTAREIDVLRLLARGLSSNEIAARLVIAPKTARNHTEHIYSKIGATNRAAASLFAVRHGLLAAD
ncbi:MAG TPA: HD domain-containing phosphohydrolase, partial [Jatrophihabitantaceae bacterium]|nr:HD domain-containing phosphohydrolase [Jatrophihabitantaceae bacterium]